MKAIVTGSSGFVGQKLCYALRLEGYEVIEISRNSENKSPLNITCDLEYERLKKGLMSDIDVVFHLAGYTHDLSNPKKSRVRYINVNIEATRHLATQASHEGVKSFVYISSVKAGGFNPPGLGFDSPIPDGIYGKTKREAELLLLNLNNLSNMRVNIIRPSLVYGPGLKGNLKLMLSGIEKGWFPPLPRISNRRSMIHVDDLIRSIILVHNKSEINQEVFIATDGRDYSSDEIYDILSEAIGRSASNVRVPMAFFNALSFLGPKIEYKIGKILGDEFYNASKLFSLGFKPIRTLKDINISDFNTGQ